MGLVIFLLHCSASNLMVKILKYDKIWGQFTLASPPHSQFWGTRPRCPPPVIYAHALLSHSVYADGTDLMTDGWTQDHYITLTATRGEHNNTNQTWNAEQFLATESSQYHVQLNTVYVADIWNRLSHIFSRGFLLILTLYQLFYCLHLLCCVQDMYTLFFATVNYTESNE